MKENINKELRKVEELAFDIIPKSILVLIQLLQHFKEQIIYNKVEERIFNPKRIIELKNVIILEIFPMVNTYVCHMHCLKISA